MAKQRKRSPTLRLQSIECAGKDNFHARPSRRGILARVPRAWATDTDISPFAVRGKWNRPVRG